MFFAVIAAGGIYGAASSGLTATELAGQIQKSKSNLVIASEDMMPVALEAARKSQIPTDRILILDSMRNGRRLSPLTKRSFNYLTECQELPWEKITDKLTLENTIAALVFSSGTTGAPKGVSISHRNFVAEAIMTQATIKTYLSRTGKNFDYRVIAHLPSAHIAGLQGYFINGTMAGGIVFWMSKFVFEDFVHAAKIHRPTFLNTVPSVYLRIAKSPFVTDQFHSIQHAQSGAAPMGLELQRMAESKFTCKLSQSWGLTETTGTVTWLPWDRDDGTGSVGMIIPNTRIKIVDDDGVDVPDSHRGEILVKGPNVTQGYWENPMATAESFTSDGWYRTGDIGQCRDGKLYILDRKKVRRSLRWSLIHFADHCFAIN